MLLNCMTYAVPIPSCATLNHMHFTSKEAINFAERMHAAMNLPVLV